MDVSMDLDMPETRPAKRQHIEDVDMIGSTPKKASVDMDVDTPPKQKARSSNTPAVPTKAPLTREEPMLAIEGSAANSTDSTASFQTADQGSLMSMGSWSSLMSNASSHLGMTSKKRGKQKAKIEDSSEELVHKTAANKTSYTQNNYYPASSPITSTWQHSDFPSALLTYLQVFFKFSLLSLGLYLLFLFIYTVLLDVAEKVDATTHELRAEIYHCAESFAANNCLGFRDVGRVAPALWGMCSEWENCMNRDPRKVGGKARLGAETIAEIVNGFVDVLNFKTMIFILAAVATVVYVTNSAITSYKHHNMPLYAHQWPQEREIHAMPHIHQRLSSSGLSAVQNHQFNPDLSKESREVNNHLAYEQKGKSSKKGWLY